MKYKNSALLALARLCPHCMGCGKVNEGDVVAAHRNEGKGLGLKNPDYMWAALCSLKCHYELDQGRHWSREQRRDFWSAAYWRTQAWLWSSGHLLVSLVPTPPPVVEVKPKAKIAKRKAAWPAGRKLQGRGFDQTAPTRKIQSPPFPKRATITSEGAG